MRLAPALYRDLTLAAEPQGIGAVLWQHWSALENAKPRNNSIWLAVESIDAPGNLGTIIRTAEATGVAGIFMLTSSGGNFSRPDPWHPATVRATMGSLFAQRIIRCSREDFTAWVGRFNVTVIGSSPQGLMNYKAAQYRRPLVLIIGSERSGLSPQLLETCHIVLRIPMVGRCDSINAAVAAGVLMFEIAGG